MEQEIINAYSENFTSAYDIYKKLNKKYSLKQIKNVQRSQILTKSLISISAPSGSFQADLTFYTQFKRQNYGFAVLLTIIEINTRFAYVFLLKDKKAESILTCLKELLDTEKQNLKSISFDQGSEFDNRLVKNFLDQDRISKYQNFQKQKNFIDELTKIVHSYNNTEHSQINMTPQKAKKTNYFDEKSNQNKQEVIQKIEEKFEIGDFVRIFKNKKLFQKGQKNYSKNIYQIIGRERNNYVLKKFKDGKLLEKEQRKTAAYLQKINIFDLFSKQKVKKEISKQDAKKQTDFIKKILKEGLDLENIIPDNDQPPPQRKFIKDILKMYQAEVQSLKQKNNLRIQEVNQENSNLRSKSVDITQQLNQQLEQKDEEIDFQNKKLIQTNKKQKYLTLLQNMRIFLDKYNKKLEQILKDKTIRIKYLKYQNYKVGGQTRRFQKAQGKQVQETLQNIQDVTQSQIDSIDKKIKEIEKQEKFNKKDLSKFINSLQEFASQLGDNYSLDEQDHQKSFNEYKEIFINLKEKAPQQKNNNLSDLNLTDSEYFRINELDNFDNEIQINQKIDELEQAIQINSDFNQIENQSRVSEYQKMIEMLRNKLDEIQNKKFVNKILRDEEIFLMKFQTIITKINNPIVFLIFQTILEKIDHAFFIKIIKKIIPAKYRYLFQISELKNSKISLKVLVTGILTTLSTALSKPSSKATFPASITPAFLVISQASGIDVNPSPTYLKNPKKPEYLSFLSWYFLSSSSFINFILSLSPAYSSQRYLLSS